MSTHDIVIIGSGLAGTSVARLLSGAGTKRAVTMITGDSGEAYAKPNLSAAFAKGASADALVQMGPEDLARALSVELLTRTRVASLDTDAHELRTVGGETLRYRTLVLATGAKPFELDIEGAELAHRVNDLDGYRRFRAALDGRRRVVVVGLGLIGTELAHDLAIGGFEVTLLGLEATPLAALVPSEIGLGLTAALRGLGVDVVGDAELQSIARTKDGLAVGTKRGRTFSADVVLCAIGITPDLDLARAAGLATRRGIVVDRALHTSARDVYALGDAVEIEGLVLPFVAPILGEARTIARQLGGDAHARLELPPPVVVVKTPKFPIAVGLDLERRGRVWETTSTSGGLIARRYDEHGVLVGFATSGTAVVEREALARTMTAPFKQASAPRVTGT